mgnify:CR=1 FL=1
MQPTNNLRFVERTVDEVFETGDTWEVCKTVTKRILQQRWDKVVWAHDKSIVSSYEWRDVPLEQESE